MKAPFFLVVDDNEVNCSVMSSFLKMTFGAECSIIESRNYEEAVAAAASHDVDVALVDLHIPGRSGLEIIEKISDTKKRPPTVVTITADTREEMKTKASRLGAAEFVTKPFSFHDLEVILRRVLEARCQK